MNDHKNEVAKESLSVSSTELHTQTELMQKTLDLKLVEMASKGDEKAFEELYMFTYRFVYGVAKHYLNNDEDIYDAIQNTYIRVYKHIDKLNSPESFVYWIRKIAENCAKTIKSKKTEEYEDLRDFESAELSDEKQSELTADITEVLKELTPEQSEILVSVYYHGMSVAEIARNKGKPKSTIHSQLKAAEKKLKELLKVRGIETPIYGGGFISMITTALRNAVGTSILSATVAQEILENVRKSDPKGSAVVTAIAKKERNKAVIKLASILVGVVAFFTALFLVVISAMGGFVNSDNNSNTSNTTTSVENILSPSSQSSEISGGIGETDSKVSSTDFVSSSGSSQSVSNISNSQLSSNSGNSSGNTQSKTNSSDTSSNNTSSKNSTSSKIETSSTYIPSGPQTVITSQNASYTLSGGKATIVSTDPYLSGNVLVPATIDGYPIVSIGKKAFSGLQLTSDLTFSEGITSIDDGAFSGSNFGRVILPEGLISIGYKAFEGCSMSELYIPKTVTSIGSPYIWWGMPNIVVDPENPYYYTDSGCLIDRRTMTVIAGDAYSTIPDGVKIIGEGAYYFGLEGTMRSSMAIPNSVTEIQRNGFAECYGLKILNLPSNLKTIGDFAFFGCGFEENLVIPDTVTYLGEFGLTETELKNVTFGRGVNKIPERFFSASFGLKTVKIPKNITEVGSYAFDYCPQLTDVYFEGTKQDRDKMIINEGNESLLRATWHYQSY